MGTTIALLLISIGLIIVSVKSIKKEKQKENEKEDYNFAGILNRSEENISDYQIEIGKLRKEFAETLLEIQGEMIVLEDKIDKLSDSTTTNNSTNNNINNNASTNLAKEVDLVRFTEEIKDTVQINFNSKDEKNNAKEDSGKEKNGIKIKEVEKLIENGLTIDEISDALKIGKGEVLLIKELYLK